ncbi:TIGR02680 family protein [Actinopolymorpha sp. NPDC004070]|uniref:TIGR02680 family protein n=1 Tax=Actinopolymorpha sp. NPDC004070 TaxID=3154548 RepID=UPI0033AC2483
MTHAAQPDQPADPHRFRLSRAGIHQVWQYDEEFRFGDGRLLLRGKNGAGKSKALEILLPFLLDGDTRRLDAAGGGKTTLRWLMLGGWSGGTNRLGFVWLEFARVEDGESETLTLGAAIKASTSTNEAKATYFVTTRVVEGLHLRDPSRRPSVDQLRELVGPENCYERAGEYRARVARELFGLTDLARYRNLVHLLYGLRRPTIGDRIESGELVNVLRDALPPLDDDLLDRVAHNFDDLDAVRDELGRLERTDAALTTFLASYRGYLRGVLRHRTGLVQKSLAELREARRETGAAERRLASLTEQETAAAKAVEDLDRARRDAEAQLRALRDSAAYQALTDLRERRERVTAHRQAVRAAWNASAIARTAEESAVQRLGQETDDIGRGLTDLRGDVRHLRGLVRSSGLDEALVPESPAAGTTVLAPAVTGVLTDETGRLLEVSRSTVRAVGLLPGQLEEWRHGLGEATTVAKARRRAARELRGDLDQVTAAERKADGLREQAGRMEAEVVAADERRQARQNELLEVSGAYADAVRAWARGLPDPEPVTRLVGTPDDSDLPVEDRALPPATPETIAVAARTSSEPVLRAHEERRDELLSLEREIGNSLASAREELRHWERTEDPEPPRSRYSTAERDPATGAPLFLLVDHDSTVPERDQAGIEAALEASGLLSAWVAADGRVLAPDTNDVVVRTDLPAGGADLTSVLRPVPGHGVSEAVLTRVLEAVGFGPSDAHSWISVDGRWRLGALGGAHTKNRSEYIGASVRAATRERRIAELRSQVGTLEAALAAHRGTRAEVEQDRDRLRRVLEAVPPGRDLTGAWSTYESAVEETTRRRGVLAAATRAAEQAWAGAVQLRARVQTKATAEGLPFDLDGVTRIVADVEQVLNDLQRFERTTSRILDTLDAHALSRTTWQDARARRETAESEYDTARSTMDEAVGELHALEAAVGADEAEILAQENAAEQRLTTALTALPEAVGTRDRLHDERILAGAARDTALADRAALESRVVAGSGQLRRPLGMPGLPAAADLGDLTEVVSSYDRSQDEDVRARIRALTALAAEIESRLGPTGRDVGDTAILGAGDRMREGLSGGYDAEVSEVDGIKRFALHDDAGAHDVAVVGERIRAAASDARQRLSTREQEVFERYLLGELGDHLTQQLLSARSLVRQMNDTLEDVRSSHGIGARLQWELPKEAGADLAAAVGLLDNVSAMRTRDQSAQLREVLRQRIEEARQADPGAGYARHLRVALDYRTWFVFTVMVTDSANPSVRRRLSHRTALSQGEQRVVSYLVLFAAAAAHFASVGRSAPTAPRLILLDDAFAKVDEPTHGRLLGLLVALDLDFVITSERLWGCFPTVPSLHIYECLRDPQQRGVATVHFTWDGKSKRLVSV